MIPKGTLVKQSFEAKYKGKKRDVTAAENVQLQVAPGVIAYIQNYDNVYKRGYGFSLDKFEKKKLVSHFTANVIHSMTPFPTRGSTGVP